MESVNKVHTNNTQKVEGGISYMCSQEDFKLDFLLYLWYGMYYGHQNGINRIH